MAGCGQTRERIVYVGYARPPAVDGAVRIATSQPVDVTIEGQADISTTLNIGGWYVITPGDLQAFIEIVREHREQTKGD